MVAKMKKSVLVILLIAAIFVFVLLLIPFGEKKVMLAPEGTFDDFVPASCSTANISGVWDKIFDESSSGITIVNVSASGGRCPSYLAFKVISPENYTYILRGTQNKSTTTNTIIITAIDGTSNATYAALVNSVTDISNLSLLKLDERESYTDKYYKSRGAAEITTPVDIDYSDYFKIKNGSWSISPNSMQTKYTFLRTENDGKVNQTMSGFVSANYTISALYMTSGCVPNWTASSVTSGDKNTTFYTDANGCGITIGQPDNETIHFDHDGNGIIGTPNDIQEDKFDESGEDFEVLINDDDEDDWKTVYDDDDDDEDIEIVYDDDTIVEFVWDFDEPLNFYEMKLSRQSSNKKYGYLIVEGIEVDKTIYVDRINSSISQICVNDDDDIKDEDDIDKDGDCDDSGEQLIECPGDNGEDEDDKDFISCEISGGYFEVSGLEHSGVKEFIGVASSYCQTVWTYGAWGACNSSGQQTRTATDSNSCGRTPTASSLVQACTYTAPCVPDWDYGPWVPADGEPCPANGKQTRTATDLKSCGTSAGKQAVTKDCTSNAGGNTMLIIIIIAVVIIILIGALIAFFLLRGNENSGQNVTFMSRRPSSPSFSSPGQVPRPGSPTPEPYRRRI